jgi:hypothetical protein
MLESIFLSAIALSALEVTEEAMQVNAEIMEQIGSVGVAKVAPTASTAAMISMEFVGTLVD